MKALKIILCAILGVVVLLVVAILVLSLPAVQRGLVTRLFPTGPGRDLELEYFHAGLSETEARGVRLTQSGGSYRVAELTADLSLFELLFRQRIEIGELIVTGLAIDVLKFESADEEEPFDGILNQMDLPMPLFLDRLRVEGQALFPGMADQPGLAEFVMTGGDFAPDREGVLQLDGEVELPGAAAFDALSIEGKATVFQGKEGRIERARLLALLGGGGQASGEGETLSADVLLLATDDGEAYRASVGRVLTNATEEMDLSNLLVLDATYRRGDEVLAGNWELNVDREELAAFVAGTELPAFAASGNGAFSYGLTGEHFDVTGELDLSIEDLATVADELAELGAFHLRSRFDLAMDENELRVGELVVELRDRQNAPLLEARNFQPIRYDRSEGQLVGAGERIDLAELTIHGLPVAWANLFFAGDQEAPALSVRGENVTGQLVVSAEADGILLDFAEPLRAEAITIFSGEETLVSEVSIEADGSGAYRGGQLEAAIDSLRAFRQEEVLLAFSGRFDSETGEFQGNVQADLPVLLGQPALAQYDNVSSGTLEARVALGDGSLLEFDGAARDLVTRDEETRLADLTFSGTIRESAENVWELDVPVVLEGAAPSDIRLAGELAVVEEGGRFDFSLTGEQLIVDDFTGLASAFSAPDTADSARADNDQAPEAPSSGEPDEEPVWAGWQGTVAVDVASIQLQEQGAVEELQGVLNVEAEAVAGSLRGSFWESPVEVDTQLQFLANEEEPYRLDGMVEAPSLAAGELFRQLQPNRPPTVEGLFVISVEIAGAGRTLPDLIDGVQGEARVQSSGGVIRLLYTENPLAGIGRVAGAIVGRFQEEVGVISQVAESLANMPYDEVRILAERDEELNFVVSDFEVLSPELHLEGVGQLRHQEGVDLLERPMRISLRLGARGPLEESLASIRVLGDQVDPLGYRQLLSDFTITGTPADPNASAFYRLLAETALQFVVPEREGEEDRERPRLPGFDDLFDIFGRSRR